ncbi:MAG: hypothetical protein HYR51_01680 [Candidatus Rokubacteria bacterium]|nr:hypothetical protein [Candidatus Rokubacteria bacterium]
MQRDQRPWTWWKTSAIAGLVAMSAGGGIMLFGDLSQSLWSVGLNLLVVGILALLVSAVGAWLADGDALPAAASDARLARLVFVVRRDRRDLYELLETTLARQEKVEVVIDRRDHPRDAFDREVVRRGWSVARVGL